MLHSLPCRAPIDPKDIIPVEALSDYDPNKVLIMTTGSQAEPRAQLSLASRQASNSLKIIPSDLVLYSAKVGKGPVWGYR
jgi:mRNA degradation ribonuclease J1/J2